MIKCTMHCMFTKIKQLKQSIRKMCSLTSLFDSISGIENVNLFIIFLYTTQKIHSVMTLYVHLSKKVSAVVKH